MKFAGLILAGGLGKRWGGPKAWACLSDGRCFLEACNTTLHTAGADRVIATLPPDSKDPEIDGLDVLVLQQLALDMFASMRCGLARLIKNPSWQTVIVLPVDHPLVHYQTIVELARAGHPASIPSFRGKHGHPLAISLTVAIRIATGELRGPTMREVLREVDAVDVVVDDSGVCINCNTPDVLENASVGLGYRGTSGKNLE